MTPHESADMPGLDAEPLTDSSPSADVAGSDSGASTEGQGPSGTDQNAKPRALLRNRDYMGWWTGNTVSALGTSISGIAFPLLVLYTTGSVAKAGLITAANMIGAVATTLWGGALADRMSRKLILIASPVVQASALAAVAVLVRAGHVPLAVLAAMACVSGLASGFAVGASTPALRRLVPKEQMAAASSQMMGRDMLAEIIGSPLGGFMFAVARWLPFGADAVSFLFASAGAAAIRGPLGPDRSSAEEKTTVLADITEGFGFVRRQPFLRFFAVFAALVNVIGNGFFLVFIALVKYRGGGPTEIGLVTSVALIGGIVGAIAAPVLLKKVPARVVMITAMWMFVASFAGVAIAPRPWEIGVALLVAMIGLAPINIVFEAYMIRLVPDALIGRISSVIRFGSTSLAWTGPLLVGLLADLFGPPGGAAVLMAATIPFAIALHLTRSLGVLDQPLEDVAEFTLTADSVHHGVSC